MYRLIIALLAAILFCGCASTRSTITEFNEAGKVIKTTETSESVISTLMSSTKDKSVIIWEDGWAAYISGSTGTTEDPTPHGKIFCGKVNKGWISMRSDQRNMGDIASVIQATKTDVAVSLDGMKSTSSKINTDTK